MAKTKNIALTEQGLRPLGPELLRRSLFRLLWRAWLVVMLPVSPFPDMALVDSDDTKIERSGSERELVRWTVAMEHDLVDRWHAFQSREDIAHEMGIPVGIVRARATRLGLPARPKHLILSS